MDCTVILSLCILCYSFIRTNLPSSFFLVLFFIPHGNGVIATGSGTGTAPTSNQFAQLLEIIQANEAGINKKLEEF